MDKIKNILTGHSSHNASDDSSSSSRTGGEGSHLRNTHPHDSSATTSSSSRNDPASATGAGLAGLGSSNTGRSGAGGPQYDSPGRGTGSGSYPQDGTTRDPYSQSNTSRASTGAGLAGGIAAATGLGHSNDPYSQTSTGSGAGLGSGLGRPSDPYDPSSTPSGPGTHSGPGRDTHSQSSSGTGVMGGIAAATGLGRSNDPYSQSSTGSSGMATSGLGRSNDPYSQSSTGSSGMGTSGPGRSNDPSNQSSSGTGIVGSIAAATGLGRSNDQSSQSSSGRGTGGSSGQGISSSDPYSGSSAPRGNTGVSQMGSQDLGGNYADGARQGIPSGSALGSSTMGTGLGSAGMGLGSGTTSQGYSSGIEPRPRMADKNASTISIKSGVMGHDDTETLHEPSTSQPAHNANAMKPFPGMPSAGYSGASSGLTGSSLPDRSVATSGSSAAVQQSTTGSTSGDGRMFTHGHHMIDTANRLDPREPDSAEFVGLDPPVNPSGSYGGAMANPSSTSRQTSGQQYGMDAGLAAAGAGIGATALGGREQLSSTTRVSQPYASDPITTARTGSGQQQSMGATSTSGMTSQGRDPYDSSSTGRDPSGQQQYGRGEAFAGTGLAGAAGYEAYEQGRGQGSMATGLSSTTTAPQSSMMSGGQSIGRSGGQPTGGLSSELRQHEAQTETHRVGEGLRGVPEADQAAIMRQKYAGMNPTDERGSHLGRDTAVAGGVGAAAYGAEREYSRHQSGTSGRQGNDDSEDHGHEKKSGGLLGFLHKDKDSQDSKSSDHHGPGVYVGSGAFEPEHDRSSGAVGTGAYEPVDDPYSGNPRRADNTMPSSGHHYVRDVAGVGAGVGAVGLGAHEYREHESRAGMTGQSSQHHYGRDVAGVGAGVGAIALGEHEYRQHETRRAENYDPSTSSSGMAAHQTFARDDYEHKRHIGTDGVMGGDQEMGIRAGQGYDSGRNTGTGTSGTGLSSGVGSGNNSGISGRAEESWEAIRKANTPY